MKHRCLVWMIFLLILSACTAASTTVAPEVAPRPTATVPASAQVAASPLPVSPTATAPPAPTASPPATTATPVPASAPIVLVDSGQRLGLAYHWDVALGDLDGDGDLDAFTADTGQDGTKIWLNDGRGVLSGSEQTLGAFMRLALGDLDGDGDLDAVVANADTSRPHWLSDAGVWLNDGLGTFTEGQGGLGGPEVFNPALGDLDGDGDLDIFFAEIGANSVWLNDGGGVFADTGQRLEMAVAAVAALGDLDGDGDLDALVGGWDSPAKAWLNDGSGTFADSGQELSSPGLHIHDLALGDLDNDRDLDAVAVVASGDPHQVWENDGRGGFSLAQSLAGTLAHGVALGDLDGVGRLDAITTHGTVAGGGIRVWQNDGLGSFGNIELVWSDLFGSAVALGDLDGDGDLDAFITHTIWNSMGEGAPNEVWLNES